ncbi:MAG: PAS domain S-box protein [Candidatus Thermoplasmatota archaeon]
MVSYQKEIEQIKKILKENPKGMTVSDIARKIKINRNSVAKYLDIMRISGLVDMITFGPAKVYFPSSRVPISNMLNHVSDYVIVFDQDLKINMINDSFLDFLNKEREEMIGQNLDDNVLKIFKENIDLSISINEALEGKGFKKEIDFQKDGVNLYFRIKILPTTFEDGGQGVALIIKNITKRKKMEKELKQNQKIYER